MEPTLMVPYELRMSFFTHPCLLEKHLYVHVRVVQHQCGGQKTACEACFSPSTMRVPGIDLRLSCWKQTPLPTEPSHRSEQLLGEGSTLFCYL